MPNPQSFFIDGGQPDFLFEIVTNTSGGPLVVGEVVRISGNEAVSKSLADTAANAQGTVGVVLGAGANGALVPILTHGKATVLLEVGLVGVAAGQTLWVSPTVAGRATNVKPSAIGNVVLCIGVIKDASAYGTNSPVVADVGPDCEPSIAGSGMGSVQCGKVVFAGETTKAVVFPTPFPAGTEPAVALTPIDQADVTVTANHDIPTTNTGFTIRMSVPYTGTVYWVACAGSAGVSGIVPYAPGVAISGTSFLGFGATVGVESDVNWVAPRPGIVRNLFVSFSAVTGPGAATTRVTVRRSPACNAAFVDTALEIPATSGTGCFSDVADAIAVAAGDRISVRVIRSAGTVRMTAGLEFA